MNKRHGFGSLMLLTLALGMARAQDPFAQPEDGASQSVVPILAFEQENAVEPVTENPPISAIDQPGLIPHAAPVSYMQAGAHITESADSNAANIVGGTGRHSVTRALGSLELQRLWRNYDLALAYVGGVGYYDVAGMGFKQLQQLDVDQKMKWKRGQLAVRDSFSYLPEGNFAGGYGSLGTSGQELGGDLGGSGFFGGTMLGGVGQVPRIMNLSLVDVSESLTPKSSVTASGGCSCTTPAITPGSRTFPFSAALRSPRKLAMTALWAITTRWLSRTGIKGSDSLTHRVPQHGWTLPSTRTLCSSCGNTASREGWIFWLARARSLPVSAYLLLLIQALAPIFPRASL
jgi:hypothetical protein